MTCPSSRAYSQDDPFALIRDGWEIINRSAGPAPTTVLCLLTDLPLSDDAFQYIVVKAPPVTGITLMFKGSY